MRTLIRHFLSFPVFRLSPSVIAPALAALLVPAVRLAEALVVGFLLAPLAAVDLSAITVPADLEHPGAATAADLTEAVIPLAHSPST